jgi:hypothetical protein
MKQNKLISKFQGFNYYILAVLILTGFSIFYFFYHRTKNQEEVYVSASISNPGSGGNNLVSNWIAEAIEVGDKEITSLGETTAQVVDSEEYEAGSSSRNVFLLLKVKVGKDRSGTYLYKNKPLLVGGVVQMKLAKTQFDAMITYIGKNPPQYKKEKLRIVLKGTQIDASIADNIKVGSIIRDNKGETVAEVIDKKLSPAIPVILRYESGSNRFVFSSDTDRKDFEVTADIMTVKMGDYNYYARTQRIKVGDSLYLPFKETGFGGTIISVSPIN